MKNIGIIAAMDEEMNAIKKLMINISQITYYNKDFICGEIQNKNVILVKSGVGKVNAAATTQVLIDKFDVDEFYNAMFSDKKVADKKINFIMPIKEKEVAKKNNIDKNLVVQGIL